MKTWGSQDQRNTEAQQLRFGFFMACATGDFPKTSTGARAYFLPWG